MKEDVDWSSPPFYPPKKPEEPFFSINARDSLIHRSTNCITDFWWQKCFNINNVQESKVEDLEESAKDSCYCLDFEGVYFVGRLFVGKSKLSVCLAILQQLRLIPEKHYPVAVVLDGRQLTLLDRS